MGDLKLTIETDADLGTREQAQRVLEVLSNGRFAPERFGEHEPPRGRFDPSDPEPLIEIWLGKQIRPDFWTGTVFLNRSKAVRYGATIRWVRGQSKMNSITLTVREWDVSTRVVEEVLSLGRSLFEAVGGQFGYVCDRTEYLTKNVSGWWAHPESDVSKADAILAPTARGTYRDCTGPASSDPYTSTSSANRGWNLPPPGVSNDCLEGPGCS